MSTWQCWASLSKGHPQGNSTTNSTRQDPHETGATLAGKLPLPFLKEEWLKFE